MCFSATASFAAGTALIAVGGVSLRRSRGKAELPFALVPLLFGVQQLSEGLLWLSFSNDLPLLKSWATYAFSLFSHVLWPTFVPFAILLPVLVHWSGPMQACRPELMRSRERATP